MQVQETLINGYQRENERLVAEAKAERAKREEAEKALATQMSSPREQELKFEMDKLRQTNRDLQFKVCQPVCVLGGREVVINSSSSHSWRASRNNNLPLITRRFRVWSGSSR